VGILFIIASIFLFSHVVNGGATRDIVTHLRVVKFAEQLKNKNIFFLSAFVQQTILHGE
jgi:hypothetical protein